MKMSRRVTRELLRHEGRLFALTWSDDRHSVERTPGRAGRPRRCCETSADYLVGDGGADDDGSSVVQNNQ